MTRPQSVARSILVALALWSAAAVAGKPPAVAPAPVAAEAAGPEPASIADVADQIDDAELTIDSVMATTRTPVLDDAALTTNIKRLLPADRALDDAVAILTPRLAGIDTRLAQLGPAPAKGQPPEAPEIAANRAELTVDQSAVTSELKQAKLLTVELDQLTVQLEQRRRELFAQRLWAQSRSIVSPALWTEVAAALPGDIRRVVTMLAGEIREVRTATRSGLILIEWLIAAIIAVLIAIPGRRFLIGFGKRRAARSPSRLARTLLALWRVAVTVLTALAAAWLICSVFTASGALTPAFERLTTTLLHAIVFAALVDGLGRALLSPRDPDWRIVPLSDSLAGRLRNFPAILALAVVAAGLTTGVHTAFGTSLVSSIASDSLGLCLELAVIGGALVAAGRDRLPGEIAGDDASPGQASGRGSQLPWIIAAAATWLGLTGAVAALIFGYLALANFIVREIVWIAVVLASLFLLIRTSDDLFPALLRPTRFGRTLTIAVGLSPQALAQMGILLSGIARVVLLVLGWTLVVAPFGAGASDIFGRITSADLVIHIGQSSISPGTIIGGIVILFAGLFITRGVRGWLEARYLPATAIDIGVQTSLAAAVSYVGVVLAVIFTTVFLGLSLDRIALFASALSIGIGFGLQSVISNFVSGLILLVERPVKVGDWIAIGDLEGDVRKINVRATEIEMKDQSRLIVPNLDLITKTVRNVTHAGALGRIRIVIRVNDDADPIALRELILTHLTRHPEVLKEPAPAVYLTDAKDGGLEFTSFAFAASARDVYHIRSDLLFALVPALKASGFALANSTPIVNLGVDGRLIEPALAPGPAPE